MKLQSIDQAPQSTLGELQFDVVIAASGYESRAPYVSQSSNISGAGHRLTFGFRDRVKLARLSNDKKFKRLGFKAVGADGHTGEIIKEEVENAIRRTPGERATVLVDYSCMTKIWYAARLFCAF